MWDEIAKQVLVNSPTLLVVFLLGRSLIELLKQYLEAVVLRHDRVLARLEVIERQLNIVPPVEDRRSQVEATQRSPLDK